MSVKKQETITHRILQKSTGKKIGCARIFPQYEDMEVKDMKLIHCDKISNNNEVIKILNEDLNLSSSEDEEVDYEDMIIESIKDLTSSSEDEESENSSDEDEGININDSKTNNNSYEILSEVGETSRSESSTATMSSATNQTTSSLKSFYQTLEADPKRVRCKLCAKLGIEKIIVSKHISRHIKNVHKIKTNHFSALPRAAATLKPATINNSNETYERGGTSKPASSSAETLASSFVTLKSLFQTIEDEPTRVRCKLCAEVGIENITSRSNFSRHVKTIHKINNNSCGISSGLGLDDKSKSDSSALSKAATLKSPMQINNADESYERGETSKPASSANASASSSSQRVTLKSFFQTLEDDPKNVRCKLCAIVGIEKVTTRKNFSEHVKSIHEVKEKEKCVHCGKMYKKSSMYHHIKNIHGDGKRKVSCEYCGKPITKMNLSKHIKRCSQKNKELNE